MFRKLRRENQALDEKTCAELLRSERRGVLAMLGDGGYPYAIPVNFYYDEKANCIYLHGSKSGHKLDAIDGCDKVCFTVFDKGVQRPGDWAYDVNSVVAFCRAERMEPGQEAADALACLAEKYFPPEENPAQQARQGAPAVQMLRLRVQYMTGKRVFEK